MSEPEPATWLPDDAPDRLHFMATLEEWLRRASYFPPGGRVVDRTALSRLRARRLRCGAPATCPHGIERGPIGCLRCVTE